MIVAVDFEDFDSLVGGAGLEAVCVLAGPRGRGTVVVAVKTYGEAFAVVVQSAVMLEESQYRRRRGEEEGGWWEWWGGGSACTAGAGAGGRVNSRSCHRGDSTSVSMAPILVSGRGQTRPGERTWELLGRETYHFEDGEGF